MQARFLRYDEWDGMKENASAFKIILILLILSKKFSLSRLHVPPVKIFPFPNFVNLENLVIWSCLPS